MKDKKLRKSEGIHSFIYQFPEGLLDKSFIVKDGYLYAFNISARRVLQCIIKLDQIKIYEMNKKCITSLCDRRYRFFFIETIDGFKFEIAVNDDLCNGLRDPFQDNYNKLINF